MSPIATFIGVFALATASLATFVAAPLILIFASSGTDTTSQQEEKTSGNRKSAGSNERTSKQGENGSKIIVINNNEPTSQQGENGCRYRNSAGSNGRTSQQGENGSKIIVITNNEPTSQQGENGSRHRNSAGGNGASSQQGENGSQIIVITNNEPTLQQGENGSRHRNSAGGNGTSSQQGENGSQIIVITNYGTTSEQGENGRSRYRGSNGRTSQQGENGSKIIVINNNGATSQQGENKSRDQTSAGKRGTRSKQGGNRPRSRSEAGASSLDIGSESTPYCWQFKEAGSGSWRNFGPSDNIALEMLYCDVENLEVKINLNDTPLRDLKMSSTQVSANFQLMYIRSTSSNQFLLRRNSTPSYVQEPNNELSTKWVWYWEDIDGWKKYAETKQSSGTRQEQIEAAYLNEDGIYFFQIGSHNYSITFDETFMYQMNMDPNLQTIRPVRRRPLFVSKSVLATTRSDLEGKAVDFERTILENDCEEYRTVCQRFHETMPERKASIVMVEKIRNDELRTRYISKRKRMLKKLKATSKNQIEKLLFHGTTSDVLDAICKQNFDHRSSLRGKNGTRYGEGSYFALAASYSNNYGSQSGEQTRFMFLANVLTGEYKLGNQDFRRPPLKDPSNPASDLYDSCVDNESQPKIFVIFNDEQCYPTYLIKYRLNEL